MAGDILSIADVRWLDGIDEAKRLSSRIKKLKQRVKGDSGGNETVDSLRDEISGLQKDIADSTKTAEETRAEIYDKFAIELHGLKGLAMAMEESGSEITLALSDLLGPAVNRLLNLIEELEQAS